MFGNEKRLWLGIFFLYVPLGWEFLANEGGHFLAKK